MKTTLLRRLRSRIIIYERNKEYFVHDNEPCRGNSYPNSNWVKLEQALKIRHDYILRLAQNYKCGKRTI